MDSLIILTDLTCNTQLVHCVVNVLATEMQCSFYCSELWQCFCMPCACIVYPVPVIQAWPQFWFPCRALLRSFSLHLCCVVHIFFIVQSKKTVNDDKSGIFHYSYLFPWYVWWIFLFHCVLCPLICISVCWSLCLSMCVMANFSLTSCMSC